MSLLNRVLDMLACSRAWHVSVLTCLPACMLTCFVLGVLTCLACLRTWCACYDEMFYFLTHLHTWCTFLSYLFYISILKFKNCYNEKFVCFIKLNIFLIYILIPTYTTIRNQFKGSRKVNSHIAAVALKQYQFFTIYIFAYYINFCWTHCFCLIYCQVSY